MTTDTRNAKGWPNVFADGRGIGSLRASIYTDAAHGAHLRGLYADFLDEAAELLGRDALARRTAWRAAADAWDRDRRCRAPARRRAARAHRRRSATAAARWSSSAARDEAADVPPPSASS